MTFLAFKYKGVIYSYKGNYDLSFYFSKTFLNLFKMILGSFSKSSVEISSVVVNIDEFSSTKTLSLSYPFNLKYSLNNFSSNFNNLFQVTGFFI